MTPDRRDPFDPLTVPLDPGVTVVEASAGTGKTFAITRLLLRCLLERRVAAPSEVLVVTFTENGTQELVRRVRTTLREAARIWSDDPPPGTIENADLFTLRDASPADGRDIIAAAIARLDDLSISTIHAFCYRVLAERALESRVHFRSALLEDDRLLLHRAAHDWARRTLVTDAVAAELAASLGADPAGWVDPLVRPLRRQLRYRVDTGDGDAARLLADFVDGTIRISDAERRRRHVLGFDDLLRRMHEVLQDEGCGGPLARCIRASHRVAFVDECQDTDPIQYRIFETAFHGCPLFLIGDPKQSIFAFRGADIRTYLGAARDAHARFTFGTNHRSAAAMVDAVGALFTRRADPFGEGNGIGLPDVHASGRVMAPAALEGDGLGALHWWYLPRDHPRIKTRRGLAKEAGVELSIRETVAEVCRLRHAGLPSSDMAVLVGRNDDARHVKRELDRVGIPAVVGSDADLLASEEADDLFRIALAVAEPTDGYAVRAAMATRLWGADAAQIAASLQGDGEEAWAAIVATLRATSARWLSDGVGVALAELLDILRAPERILALEDGERRMTNVRHLLELLREAAARQALPPAAIRAWFEGEGEQGTPPERRELRLESDRDAVQVMTIHKAKGLQWPVVFCPLLWHVPDPKQKLLGLEPAVTSEDGTAVLDLGSPAASDRSKVAKEERLQELIRLTYVALTRARARCYVAWGAFSNAENSGLGWLFEGSTGRAPLDDLVAESGGTMSLSLLGDQRPPASRVGLPTGVGDSRPILPRTFAADQDRFATWRQRSFSGLAHGSHADGEARDIEDAVIAGALQEPPVVRRGVFAMPGGTALGTALHGLLEHLDFASLVDPEVPSDADLAAALHRHGILPPADGSWTLADVRVMVRRVGTAPIPDAGFAFAHLPRAVTLREWRFTIPVGEYSAARVADVLEAHGSEHARAYAPALRAMSPAAFRGYLTGVADLVFEHEGRWWITDWKSNYLGASPEDYHPARLDDAMHASHYTLQYHLYLLALHRHLRLRQPGYDPVLHLGGIIYVFLRGVQETGTSGWFRDTPTAALVEALEPATGGGV